MNRTPMASPPRQAHTFTSPESFGLFMEALRDLQTYAEDSEQSAPDATRLEEHLDSALESLVRCHQDFPSDLLPRYYLAISLTMKNQHLYAKSILQQIATTTSPQAGPVADATSQRIVLAVLSPRPWPLLDRAINLFQQVIQDGYSVLEQAARFNLAHVYAKRDGSGDLEKSMELLASLAAASQGAPARAVARPWAFLARLFQERNAADGRAYQESVALTLQTRTLTSVARARLAIQNGSEPEYTASVHAIQSARQAIERAEDLNPEAKHDLLADSCTKLGFIFFLHAIRTQAAQAELVDAEASLKRALDYKPFWIPAQTYLAIVYIAEARFDEARKELLSVVGSSPN